MEKVGSGFLAAIYYVSARQWQKQGVIDAGDLHATLNKPPKVIGYRTNGLAPKHQDGQKEEWFRLLVKWVKVGSKVLALKYSYKKDGKWHVVFDGETNASAMLMGTSALFNSMSSVEIDGKWYAVQHGTSVNEDDNVVHYTVAVDKKIMPDETPETLLADFDTKLRTALADSKFQGTLANATLLSLTFINLFSFSRDRASCIDIGRAVL